MEKTMLDKTLHVCMEDVRAAPGSMRTRGRKGESFTDGGGASARSLRYWRQWSEGGKIMDRRTEDGR
jgi:hypothetical protein